MVVDGEPGGPMWALDLDEGTLEEALQLDDMILSRPGGANDVIVVRASLPGSEEAMGTIWAWNPGDGAFQLIPEQGAVSLLDAGQNGFVFRREGVYGVVYLHDLGTGETHQVHVGNQGWYATEAEPSVHTYPRIVDGRMWVVFHHWVDGRAVHQVMEWDPETDEWNTIVESEEYFWDYVPGERNMLLNGNRTRIYDRLLQTERVVDVQGVMTGVQYDGATGWSTYGLRAGGLQDQNETYWLTHEGGYTFELPPPQGPHHPRNYLTPSHAYYMTDDRDGRWTLYEIPLAPLAG